MFPLKTGFADYMLYAEGKAIGIVEAKPAGHSLVGIDTQRGKYLDGLPKNLPHYRLPLPFGYESTGAVTLFRNTLEIDSRSRPVFSFHQPGELIRLVGLDQQVRTLLRAMPAINERDLWRAQNDPKVFVPHRDRRTRKMRSKLLDEDLVYSAKQLDRDVVNLDQIRVVIRTFKERLPEIFPGRTEVPKTLVFAKTDSHADDIVTTIREVFGKGNDFCTKITSKSDKPYERLQEFRNSFHPRIAVTVDMIATGTDVKPLECLLFLRDVRSLTYFEQMKGRVCRVIDADKLQSVTPDSRQKTHFVIVDAVGVCESLKSTSKPLDRKPNVALAALLDLAGKGAVEADLVSALADRLTKLGQQLTDEQRAEIEKIAGQPIAALSAELLHSIDPETIAETASRLFNVDAASCRVLKDVDAASCRVSCSNVDAASCRVLKDENTRQDAASTDEIGYFDPSAPIAVLDGNLPHFRQAGTTYFVTFRTADSLPQVKL